MSKTAANLPQAFKLVRDLLAEQPRTFQELLRAGIAAVPSAAGSSSAALSAEVEASGKGKGRAVAGGGAGRKALKGESAVETVVPEGHPFVSAKYVKSIASPSFVNTATAGRSL